MNLPDKNRKMPRAIFAAAVILSLFSGAFGWNKPGHMVTGAIAARELKANDPEALAKVVALLKENPFFKSRWKAEVKKRKGLDDEAVVLFAFAARWADDVRNTPDDHENAHFINFPFKPEDQPASVIVKDPLDDNIETAFEANLDLLENSNDIVQRAKALCWLFHLTGDSHQPLHSTALFTTVFPNGDRGGTRFFVRIGGQAIKLHAQWDNAVIDSENFADVHDTYLNIVNKIGRDDLTGVDEDDMKEWVQESFEMAKEKAYLNGALKGGTSTQTAKPVPSGYVSNTKKAARERMALAGYRLADLLQRLF